MAYQSELSYMIAKNKYKPFIDIDIEKTQHNYGHMYSF